MGELRYSKDLGAVVEIQNRLSSTEALRILVTELLGADYYIEDPVDDKMANVIIVEDILKKYKKRWLQ